MAIDLSIIAPKARENYLRIGRQFGSIDTINQASKTIEGCDTYLDVLKLHGFGAADKLSAYASLPPPNLRRA